MLASTAMPAPRDPEPPDDRSDHETADQELADGVLREMYWARDTAARARLDTSEVRHRLQDLSAQLRTDETLVIPMGEPNLASISRWRRRIKFYLWRIMRPATWRYDRLIADHAELTTSLAEKVMLLEAEVERLSTELASRDETPAEGRDGGEPS